jgi:hypothetical protein
VSDDFEPTTEYPPATWESDAVFEAPGPMSRPLANYLAMCAPRSHRVSRANRFRVHADRSRPERLRSTDHRAA